jgi:hypothetical protein
MNAKDGIKKIIQYADPDLENSKQMLLTHFEQDNRAD